MKIIQGSGTSSLGALADRSFNFRTENYEGLSRCVMNTDWDFLFGNGDAVEDVIVDFYELLSATFRAHVPIKRRKNSSHPPWFNRSFLKLRNQKSSIYRPDDDTVYSNVRDLSLHINWHTTRIHSWH